MLPPEILDQVTALNSQNRELVGIINQLTRVNRGQLELDELSSTIKSGFAEADRAIEVFLSSNSSQQYANNRISKFQ